MLKIILYKSNFWILIIRITYIRIVFVQTKSFSYRCTMSVKLIWILLGISGIVLQKTTLGKFIILKTVYIDINRKNFVNMPMFWHRISSILCSWLSVELMEFLVVLLQSDKALWNFRTTDKKTVCFYSKKWRRQSLWRKAKVFGDEYR